MLVNVVYNNMLSNEDENRTLVSKRLFTDDPKAKHSTWLHKQLSHELIAALASNILFCKLSDFI